MRSSLEQELDENRYLIVICSPRSAKSEWVNSEILHFLAIGRDGRILPIIVDGVPHSGDPDSECYPLALLNLVDDPPGVDIKALGRRKARLRMVATLLDVQYDELLMRDSVRITTLGNKVVRLENVNSHGVVVGFDLLTSTMGYPILEFAYDDDGKLLSVLQKDHLWQHVLDRQLGNRMLSGLRTILGSHSDDALCEQIDSLLRRCYKLYQRLLQIFIHPGRHGYFQPVRLILEKFLHSFKHVIPPIFFIEIVRY